MAHLTQNTWIEGRQLFRVCVQTVFKTSFLYLISRLTRHSQARAAAIERGELSVEDPRDKVLREKKEKDKKEEAAA